MGIHPLSIIIISGQKYAGGVATLASAFLDMSYLSITPVSTSTNINDDFFLPLEIYRMRDRSIRYQWGYGKKLTLPNDNLSNVGLFWLAIDAEGYSIATDIISKSGSSPEEKIYNSVSKVNLLTPLLPPYPEIVASSKFWLKIKTAIYEAEQKTQGAKSKQGRTKMLEKRVPLTPTEKSCFSWYRLLREGLQPWDSIIRNIISAWS